MTDESIKLDIRHGMGAQKATDISLLVAEVEANERSLRQRQDELELQLAAAPALTWEDAAGKARYLLSIFATTSAAQDPRRQRLVAHRLAEFLRLSAKNE